MNYTDPTLWPQPGVYRNIPYQQYAELLACNATFLKKLAVMSAGHAKYEMDHPTVTKALINGIALHTFELEPERFAAEYEVSKPCEAIIKSGKRMGQSCGNAAEKTDDGWLCGLHSKSATVDESAKIVTPEFLALLNNAHAEMWRVAYDLLDGAERELTLVWEDPGTGLLCKARLDLFQENANLIGDIKSTQSANAALFPAYAGNYSYHLQAHWYCRGARAVLGDALYRFQFLAVELNEDEANGAALYELDDRSIEAGEKAAQDALNVYAECKRTGIWPLYSAGVKLISLRPYVIKNEERRA